MKKNEDINDIVSCIRKRKNMEEKLLSVDTLLEMSGMQTYATLCKNRIRRSPRWDENNVIDKENGRMYLTTAGMENHIDILSGYVNEKMLRDVLSYMKIMDERKNAANTLLRALRRTTKKELYALLHNPDMIHAYAEYPEIKKWMEEELYARTLHRRIMALF